MDGSKELLKKVGPVAKKAVRIGAVVAAVHTLNAGLDSQAQPVSSQVPPPPEGHHQELKGPMPSQLPITEQIKQVKALQGSASRGQEQEQTAEIKTDILIFETAYDPINGVFWTTGRHPSKGDAMALYKGRYTEGKVLWQKITEFPWMGTLPGMVAVSPTEPNILTVAGGEQNQQGPGKILISKDSSQNFQEITVSDMGAINYVTFSKNGGKIYYSTNNSVATAGIVVKVNVSDTRREAAANNGLENMQNFGGPILASPNSNETLYAVSGIAPQILVTRDGGQNWTVLENLLTPTNSDAFRVVNYQGKDVILISGNGWLEIIKEGEGTITLNTAAIGYNAGFSTLTADTSGPELRILGTGASTKIMVGGPTQDSWREFSHAGLPLTSVDRLKQVITPDGKEWLIMMVGYSGFWVYDLSQGETGSWQQMSDGLEWKDPFPHKVYLPSLSKSFSGGW